MKKNKIIFGICAITLLLFAANTVTALNQFNYNTQYPVWHYFDNALGDLGSTPYSFSGSGVSVDPGTLLCNRGISSSQRYAMKYDAVASEVYRYDISSLSLKGWYILQIDGDFKVEMSNDNANWTTVLTANGDYAWTDKGPAKNMSPYYLDLKNFLPASYLYVRFSDNTTGNGNGARALNALITEEGYPDFYAGGGEPTIGPGTYYVGDQQFLFSKDNTSDREVNGRFADTTSSFVYKFDLPDDEDDCELIAYISQQYKVEISRDWDFSSIFYSTQSLNSADTKQRISVNLKTLLSQLSDNVIYFRMSDAVTSTGWGGNLSRLWIAPQIPAMGKSFVAMDEIEAAFLWENNNSIFISDWGFRFTDAHNYAAYRFNFGAEATNLSSITISTSSEYLFQGSSNGVDWVDLFIAPAGYRNSEALTFYPFTGKTIGFGAQTGIGNLVAPVFNGSTNVFFLKMSDSNPADGWGAQMKRISIEGVNTSKFMNAKTIFQVNMYYDPKAALPVDAVIVHRHGDSTASLYNAIKSWQINGFNVGRMFFADSDAGNHYWQGDWDGQTHTNDCEHDAAGNIVSIGGYRPYMLPTTGWTAYLEEMTEQSIDLGVTAIIPEEPLAHTYTGYEESFKPIWADYYGFPWQAENSSEIARFLTGQLKAKLYLDLELDLLETSQQYGNDIDFVIPIHSIFGNIAAKLTAPLGMSVGTNDIDGYIGQIWTGPIRWALDNYSSSDESFFGSAYALYDFFTQLTIETDRKLWLLVDPVEDDPNHTWAEYLEWYEHSVAAMLFMPEVDSYEIMPWPERTFMPGYSTGGGSPAPEDFRIQVLTISQVLQDIAKGGEWLPDASSKLPTEKIAVAIADSAMYRKISGAKLQGTYGMLMPLIQRGIPVSSFAMERVQDTNYADLYKVIILSYETFKPVNPQMNVDLADWVKRGGSLLVVGATETSLDSASYFWWHGLGYNSPIEHLMAQFGGGYGGGNVIRNTTSPSAFANTSIAANTYLPLLEQAVNASDITGGLNTPGNFCMKRGDYVIARSTKSNLWVQGNFVNIFDADLPVINNINLSPGQSGLFKDVTDILTGNVPALLHTSHRLMSQENSNDFLKFTINGPSETPAVARIFSANKNSSVSARNANGGIVNVSVLQDETSALIKFPNLPDGVTVSINFTAKTITNTFEWADNVSGLSVQPQANDLAQWHGSTNILINGSMHTGVSDNKFEYLFNSDVDGSYGPGGPNANGFVLFNDGMSPDNDAVIHCDFDSPKLIEEINVFSKWSDHRLFTYFEVFASTTGTNDSDYIRIGQVTFGKYGETNTYYNNKNCLARLYDPTDNILAENVTSVKLVEKNCAYEIATGSGVKQAPGTPLGSYSMILAPAVGEIDIIGVPEPVAIYYLLFIIYNLLIRKFIPVV